MKQIPFHKAYITGKEQTYIQQVLESKKVAGGGRFTIQCHEFLKKRFAFPEVFLTSSCTDALEMSALLLDIKEGDEVILPAYTFVSTANAFLLRGAKVRFCDSKPDHPNIDLEQAEMLINKRTKAIVLVHYGGFACDMDKALEISQQYSLELIEDAAHAIQAYYKGKSVGSFGKLATLSFHETKNIISGEGGALVVNNPQWVERAKVLREKGTNKTDFLAKKVSHYEWVDIGSSYLPSEITAAFLWAQLEGLEAIQQQRHILWERYYQALKPLAEAGKIELPKVTADFQHNASLFYLVCNSATERRDLIAFLKERGVESTFHYIALHQTRYYTQHYASLALPNAEKYSQQLLRLPFYTELTEAEVEYISELVIEFYER
ncbi:dTDP-4-amino-4,6-dideoxygalactose transaminase [Rapidithrix thailandica]|uniref:dTDP-4-amino-4,6-dideoxygalactose transaminase n=1 Tax=Rapidithrix thailandica TaxID=413964 RepID=A0AAW9SG96_9BACT